MANVINIFTENNDFQRIEVLKRNREKRKKYGTFFVEGVKSIDRIVNFEWEVESLIYASEKNLSNWAKAILNKVDCTNHYELPQCLMEKISDKEEPSELIALVKIPSYSFDLIKPHNNLLVVICDRPSNPGNLGTIIRSCDSFKVDSVLVTGHAVDIYDPNTIRSSVGSLFSIPVFRVESKDELIQWIDNLKNTIKDLQIVGTTAKTDEVITSQNFKKPTILLLGNETDGLSRSYKEMCDFLVKIPIHGTASSLNVGCATSICLYEIDRQRNL